MILRRHRYDDPKGHFDELVADTGTEELLSPEPLELLPWEPGGEPWKPSCDMPAGTPDTDPLGVFGKP